MKILLKLGYHVNFIGNNTEKHGVVYLGGFNPPMQLAFKYYDSVNLEEIVSEIVEDSIG